MQELLNCEDDVEDVFCQTFQISHTSMGETVTIDLKPMGSEIPVTNKNRGEYVDLYVKFLLVDAIQRQFQVSVCTSPRLLWVSASFKRVTQEDD